MNRQSRTQKVLLAIALTMVSLLLAYPAAAGFVRTNVVLRAGPSVQVPAVGMVMAGSRVHLYGCESGYKWCDVRVAGRRGWMSSHYVTIAYRNSMVLLPTYVQMTQKPDIAVVPFNIDSYWSRNYSGFYFYDEIGTWRNVDWVRDE